MLPSSSRKYLGFALVAILLITVASCLPPLSSCTVHDAEAATLKRGDVARAASNGIVLDSDLHTKTPIFNKTMSTTQEKDKETSENVYTYSYALSVPAKGNATLGTTVSVRWNDVGFDGNDDRIDLVLEWLPDSKWYSATSISRVPLLQRYTQNGYHTAGICVGVISQGAGSKISCEEHIRVNFYKHGTTQRAKGSFLTKFTDLDQEGWDGAYGDRWCESIEFISGHGQNMYVPNENILKIGKNRNGEDATDYRAVREMDGSSLNSGVVTQLDSGAEFWYYSTHGWTDILDQFDPKTITLQAGNGGRVHCAGKQDSIAVGWRGNRSVSIEANRGYKITDVQVDGHSVGTPSSYAFQDVTTDRTLSASFSPISYTFRFHENGGSGSMGDLIFHYDELKNLTANSFVRTGYRFTGWNTSPEGNGTPYLDQQEIANLTSVDGTVIDLYAQWEPISYQVSFDSQGGEGTMTNERFAFDERKALPFNRFARQGYLFAGWNTDPAGNAQAYANEQEVCNLTSTEGSVITLYAQWKPITYFVSFDAHGGEGTMDDQVLTFDQLALLNANQFVLEGFHWFKWNSNPSVPETWYDDEAPVLNLAKRANEVVSLYAIWMANRCLVVFEGNGGTGHMEAQSFAYNTAEPLHPNTFKKKGAHWVSWNTAPDGTGTSYEDEQLVKNLRTEDNSTVILYAQWEDDEPEEPDEPDKPEEPEEPGEPETPPQDESNENGQDPPANTTPEENQPPAEAELPDDTDASGDASDVLVPTEPQPEPEQNDAIDAEQQGEAREHKVETPQQTGATSNDDPSVPKASFAKTGAATLGVMCVAFVLLVGGNAILIIGAHKRKRAREQRRRIFRSLIDS